MNCSSTFRSRLSLAFALCVLGGAEITQGAESATNAFSMPDFIRRYQADRGSVGRFYELPWSKQREARLEKLLQDWGGQLQQAPFDSLNRDGQVDYLLLRTELESETSRLHLERTRRDEMEPLLPFLRPIHELEVARWQMLKLDVPKAASVVAGIPDLVKDVRKAIDKARKKKDGKDTAEPEKKSAESADTAGHSSTVNRIGTVSPALAQRTASAVTDLRNALKAWSGFYDGFVPEFSWWMKKPNEAAFAALDDYAKYLKEEIAGLKGKDEDPLVGDPIGKTSLANDLASEWLAYSAEDLLAIGEKELAWCEGEMKKAAAAMGLGSDWKAALARVKADHVGPGQQDQIVTEDARAAIEFVKTRNLVTIPPLCEELWRTSMLSTDAQKTLPYAAYSGPTMLVAYARDDMKHDDKLMSMRGNNRNFTRIVTAHELIPGHHLEAFMTARYNDHRRSFRTPFFVEGWALYWEITLWNLEYGRTPEERVGMLFWRMHRCARIIVSLKFHLGQMTPEQMVNFIVDRVGHERMGATSEVRRFIGGGYSPLYQCAYMIGGLQLKALHDELVGDGRMTDRQFNDAVLRLGAIPIELMRASLTNEKLEPGSKPSWRPIAVTQR